MNQKRKNAHAPHVADDGLLTKIVQDEEKLVQSNLLGLEHSFQKIVQHTRQTRLQISKEYTHNWPQ